MRNLFVVLTAAALAGSVFAAVTPVLKPEQALLAKIKALPENTWMKLPPVKVTGDLAWLARDGGKRRFGPSGRSYCNHAYWAPERKRALFCGGGHNTNRINDVWEYDLAANTWVCLKGADPECTYREEWFRKNAKMLKNGVIACKSGGFIWYLNHSWDQVSYDPSRKLLLWVHSQPRSIKPGLKLEQEGNVVEKGLGMTHDEFMKKLCKDGIYVWPFDPEKKKWLLPEFILNFKRPGNTIGGRQESAMLEYIPEKKTLVFGGSYLYAIRDPGTGTWIEQKGSSGAHHFTGAYAPNIKKLIAFIGTKTLSRSIGDKKWKTILENGPSASTGGSAAKYDPVSKKILLFNAGKQPNLWVYDPLKNNWTDPKPQGDAPTGPLGGQRMIVYLDIARNVLVYYGYNKGTWVYRYRRAGK